ncbi:uncharacterized protein B0H18DRAFT_966808 [Fomitopsis serialis]|uniref:uncharacterized protein n=1 Tax=Fomitopsis serialis TaxID=139415 RepID=UPI0020086169|nr:uncharacterized protein B0H18DRAFT_966808 [Neoantrodia serialis]KAH9938365.1 hypothetical protein B0H18DRAFT_966808 [Neoantrodia serialis]
MDEDAFGSVWGAPAPSPLALKPIATAFSSGPTSTDGFDDFDDFGTPAETIATSALWRGTGPGEVPAFAEDVGFGEEVRISGPSTSASDWEPLRLHPLPSRPELQEQVDHILAPLWASIDDSQLTDEDIRQTGGLNQTLVTPESRQLYKILLPNTPPAMQPVNWTRSRIRRRHLISLGIPVNLDEVLPKANGKLPTLEITTRPMSAPPGPRTAPVQKTVVAQSSSRVGSPRPGTPVTSLPNGVSMTAQSVSTQLRLGPRPELDETKLNQLLEINPDKLTLQPIATLEKHLTDLQSHTMQVSTTLTHLLQTRDALKQDSETYNKLIGELVADAQKRSTAKRVGGGKRSTLS